MSVRSEPPASPLSPPPREPGRSEHFPHGDCRVSNVIPTSTIFAAALERLNRNATIELLQKLMQEVDAHCRALTSSQAAATSGAQQSELLALVALLRQTTEQHRSEVTAVQTLLAELHALSLKTHADLESRLSSLVNHHVEQSLAPALATASAKFELSAATVLDRELKQFGEKLMQDLKAREHSWRRYSCIVILVLVLVALGGGFAIGLLTGRRPAAACPPAAVGLYASPS